MNGSPDGVVFDGTFDLATGDHMIATAEGSTVQLDNDANNVDDEVGVVFKLVVIMFKLF